MLRPSAVTPARIDSHQVDTSSQPNPLDASPEASKVPMRPAAPQPTIQGLGLATPEHCMSQQESLQMFSDIVCSDDRQRRLARALYRKSGVLNRHTCVPHQVAYGWCQSTGGEQQGGNGQLDAERLNELLVPPSSLPEVQGGRNAGPTTLERMTMYRMFAPSLAELAAQQALRSAGANPDEITHLVTVTCTGFAAPGVELELIERLGLPRSTQRINVGFMGCHGAINGLRAAQGVSALAPNAKVLLVAVELCSLHYRFQWDSEGIIGNALFADGAASLVLASSNSLEEEVDRLDQPAGWQLLGTGSFVIPESQQSMSWHVGNHGFEMLLTNEVGERIEQELAGWLDRWLEQFELTRDQIDHWGVHPGGPRILSAVETSLQLSEMQLSTSRRILRDFGNMSSPTVLFILNEFMSQPACHDTQGRSRHVLLLAFGPGLVAEVALLRTTGPRERSLGRP